MSEHSEFLERRRKYIGSSDIGAILGLNPWRNAKDVYLDKVYGKDPALIRGELSEAAEIGNALEPPLVRWGADKVGVKLMEPLSRENTKGNCGCQHDGLSEDYMQGFEAKTAGIVYAHMKSHQWGDEGTNQIPETYLLQATHQLYVGDLEVVHVPALIGGRGRLLYRVNRNEDLIKVVSETAEEFWQKYIARQVEPPDTEPAHIPLLKALRRTPEKTVEVNFDLVQKWNIARGMRLNAEKEDEAAKTALLDALGDAEAGTFEFIETDTGAEGNGIVTYFQQKGADNIDRKKLKAQFPDVYEQVTSPNQYRVLRQKKGK